MKIGVLLSPQPPQVGGGHTFQEDILHSITEISDAKHEFVFICRQARHEATYLSCFPNVAYAPDYCSNDDNISNQVDVIVNELSIDLVWCLGPLGIQLGVPVIVTVFDLAHRQLPHFPEFKLGGWDWCQRERHYSTILPRAALIVTGTEFCKRLISTCYSVPEANIVVNPLTAPTFPQCGELHTLSSTDDYTRCDSGYLFYPAQFWPHKNHINLLRALDVIRSKYHLTPNLVLSGSDQGNLNHVLDCVSELRLTKSVNIIGFVSRKSIQDLYINAAMLVYPSLFGPDNIPPLEAFSLGCPVALANNEGATDQICPESALYFDPLDPEDIAAKVYRLLTTSTLRESLISAGAAIAAKRTVRSYVERIMVHIESLEGQMRCWALR